MPTRYVNTASSAGGDGTTNNTSGATRAYASLSEAVTALPADITTGGSQGVWTIECSGSAEDTTAVTLSGKTTSATYYIVIQSGPSDRAGTSWDTGKYRLSAAPSGAGVIESSVPYVRYDGLQIQHTDTPTTGNACAIRLNSSVTSDHRVSNCLLRGGRYALRIDSGGNVAATVWNTVCYGAYAGAIACLSASAQTVYSSTCIGGAVAGIYAFGAGVVTAKNVYASCTSGTAYLTGSGSFTMTNCAASDTSAAGTAPQDNIALNTTNFTNVTVGSENFALPAGSALIGVGTDTSGEGAPLNFTTDINGATRTTTWDIGADEYIAAGGGSVLAHAHHYYRLLRG